MASAAATASTTPPDPKTLASAQSAFAYPLPAVRLMERQLRAEADAGKDRVRSVVGSSYRSLLGTAERIVHMSAAIAEVEAGLGAVGRACGSRVVEGKIRNY